MCTAAWNGVETGHAFCRASIMLGANLLSMTLSLIEERKSESEDIKSEAIFQCACKNAHIEDKFEFWHICLQKCSFSCYLFIKHCQLHNGVRGVSHLSVNIPYIYVTVQTGHVSHSPKEVI